MASAPFSPASCSRSSAGHSPRACPHCGSRDICRSRVRGVIERHIVRALRFYPHRCESCDRRFYVQLSSSEIP